MSMDYRGFQKLLKSFESVQVQYESFINKFLLEMAMRCMSQTKKLTPVDTGNLRNKWELSNIKRIGDELQIEVINPEEYASFVEDGHWQDNRFLPIYHLDTGSKRSQQLAATIRTKYGPDAEGIMLKEKWVPGYHMARISITRLENEIPARFERAFKQFLKNLEVI